MKKLVMAGVACMALTFAAGQVSVDMNSSEHGRTLSTEVASEHGRTLSEHGRTLSEHGRTLTVELAGGEHGRSLSEHGRTL